MQREVEKLATALGVAVANRTTAAEVNGSGRLVQERSEVIGVCLTGAMAANTTCTFKLEQSDAESSGYTDIPGATAAISGTQTSAVQLISARPTKKYVRATLTTSGAGIGNGALNGMHLLIVPARGEPVVNSPANVIA